jgi:hypothetical protein
MQEVPLLPLWVTVFIAIWAVVWPLVGILLGHYLTRSWQRRQWIADNQKEEYRRLLVALNDLSIVFTVEPLPGQQVKDALHKLAEAVNTSLFITDFLEESKVLSAIIAAGKTMTKDGVYENYSKEHWKAVNQIIAAAKKHTG